MAAEYITDLLARYKDLRPPHESLKKSVAYVIQEVCGITVQHTYISISHTTAYIKNQSPTVHTEVRLKQKEISEALARATNGVIQNIR